MVRASLIAVATVAAAASVSAKRCGRSCPRVLAEVCGDDGITYRNTCVAQCKGAEVVYPGPCDEREDDSSILGAATFAGLAAIEVAPAGEVRSADVNVDDLDSNNTTAEIDNFLAVLPDGSRWAISAESSTKSSLRSRSNHNDSSGVNEPNYGNKSIGTRSVIGYDSRGRVSGTTYSPFRWVGQLYGSQGHCTATVVSRTAILTAAHCIHDYKTGAGTGLWTFAPGRNAASGWLFAPYGIWHGRSATYLTAYELYGRPEDDIAIMHLHPNSAGQYIGDVVGWAGSRSVVATGYNSALNDLRVSGYPGDKPYGEMWTSGKCEPSFYVYPSSPLVAHKCDTYGGNSGSALMDSAGYVSGVHTSGGTSSNYGNVLTSSRWDMYLRWKTA